MHALHHVCRIIHNKHRYNEYISMNIVKFKHSFLNSFSIEHQLNYPFGFATAILKELLLDFIE